MTLLFASTLCAWTRGVTRVWHRNPSCTMSSATPSRSRPWYPTLPRSPLLEKTLRASSKCNLARYAPTNADKPEGGAALSSDGTKHGIEATVPPTTPRPPARCRTRPSSLTIRTDEGWTPTLAPCPLFEAIFSDERDKSAAPAAGVGHHKKKPPAGPGTGTHRAYAGHGSGGNWSTPRRNPGVWAPKATPKSAPKATTLSSSTAAAPRCRVQADDSWRSDRCEETGGTRRWTSRTQAGNQRRRNAGSNGPARWVPGGGKDHGASNQGRPPRAPRPQRPPPLPRMGGNSTPSKASSSSSNPPPCHFFDLAACDLDEVEAKFFPVAALPAKKGPEVFDLTQRDLDDEERVFFPDLD